MEVSAPQSFRKNRHRRSVHVPARETSQARPLVLGGRGALLDAVEVAEPGALGDEARQLPEEGLAVSSAERPVRTPLSLSRLPDRQRRS